MGKQATKQVTKILRYMQEHGSITQREAYKLGCMRLGARIYEMRTDGYIIKTEFMKVTNADGTKTAVAKYSLEGRL